MKPSAKIIDAQDLARYIDSASDQAGMFNPQANVIKVFDIMEWLIGANNRIQHNHARFVDELDILKGSDPEIILAMVDRTEFILLDGKSFREKAKGFFASDLIEARRIAEQYRDHDGEYHEPRGKESHPLPWEIGQ